MPLPCWKHLSSEQYRHQIESMVQEIEIRPALSGRGAANNRSDRTRSVRQDPRTEPSRTKNLQLRASTLSTKKRGRSSTGSTSNSSPPSGGGRPVEVGGPARPVSDRQLSASSPVCQGVPLGAPRARIAIRSEAKDSNHPAALPGDLISPGVTLIDVDLGRRLFPAQKGTRHVPFSKP